MKCLLFVFAAYLLALSCFPCMCDDAGTEPRVQQQAANPIPANNNNNDNCNPFCSCACCLSSTFLYQKEFQITTPVIFNKNNNFTYTDQHFISYNAHSIWQPPKLS